MAYTTLQKIQRAAVEVLLPLDSQSLFETCIREAMFLAQANWGSLFLEKNDRLVRVYSTVPQQYRVTPRPNGNTYQSFLDGKIRFMNKQTIHKAHPEADGKHEVFILIPLKYQRKNLGVIALQSWQKIQHGAELKRSLKVFGSLVALAIRNMQLYESTQDALQSKEFFMSTAAHELRNPLAAIRAYGQLAQKTLTLEQPIKLQWLDAIVSNSFRLETLIKDLFSLSQMSMGIFTYSFKKLDLLDVLSKSVADNIIQYKTNISLQKKIRQKTIEIEADPDKIALVFSNIISNAIKYSDAQKPIEITIRKRTPFYVISFVDQGRGIPKEDLPYVFEQFFQGKHGKSNGMGLGMYLCKEIVEAHHGEIKVSSKVGIGTTVDIFLPMSE
jgi:signal transduction histidine kinase